MIIDCEKRKESKIEFVRMKFWWGKNKKLFVTIVHRITLIEMRSDILAGIHR